MRSPPTTTAVCAGRARACSATSDARSRNGSGSGAGVRIAIGPRGSVVVSPLQEFDPVGLDQVDTSMLLGDAPQPDVGAEVPQRLGLADTLERFAQHGFDEIEHALCRSTICLDPMAQVVDEFRVEDREP